MRQIAGKDFQPSKLSMPTNNRLKVAILTDYHIGRQFPSQKLGSRREKRRFIGRWLGSLGTLSTISSAYSEPDGR